MKHFLSHHILKSCSQKIHRSVECNLISATSYRSDKRAVTFQIIKHEWNILSLFDDNSSFRSLRIILSDLRFTQHFSVREIWCFSLFFFFSLLLAQNEVNELLNKGKAAPFHHQKKKTFEKFFLGSAI